MPALDAIADFFKHLTTENRNGPPTLLFNEGWMLRLVLGAAARGVSCLPAPFEQRARWYTEALLYSPFAARSRLDQLAESATHADGVIGHFHIGRSSRGALHVDVEATQFVVAEAKMFSPLSAGTKRAPGYDQAARNVACMAWALKTAGRRPHECPSLGFWVVAPHEQLATGVFGCVSRESIEERIRARIDAYDSQTRENKLEPWFRDWVRPLVDRIHLACVSWEQVIADASKSNEALGLELESFYRACLQYNRVAPPPNQ